MYFYSGKLSLGKCVETDRFIFVNDFGYCENYSKMFTYRENGRPDYQLIYVKHGKLTIHDHDRKRILTGGDVCFFRPYEPQIYSIDGENTTHYWILFTGSEVKKMLEFFKERSYHIGAFWFREGDWQYVMYSGGCYDNDSYHIGYVAAHSHESDLTRVQFVKHTNNGKFAPVMYKNDFEEGSGHHSVIKYKGQYYAIYHARDLDCQKRNEFTEARTARVCKLHVNDGVITAERYCDHI